MKIMKSAALTALLACSSFIQIAAQQKGVAQWTFAVSGDSRNCGDVVMPSIAAAAANNHAAFYWHLGDLRAIYGVDEDYQYSPEHRWRAGRQDRKSTRLNSSHSQISYAVFCLKKKKS